MKYGASVTVDEEPNKEDLEESMRLLVEQAFSTLKRAKEKQEIFGSISITLYSRATNATDPLTDWLVGFDLIC